MKTSNKLLLGLCAFIGLTMISGMGIAKKNMVIHDLSITNDRGELQTRILVESYESSTLILDESLVDQYTLDPDLSNISISANGKLANQFRISDDEGLRFYRQGEGDLDSKKGRQVKITIGVKDKEELTIYLSHKARLDNKDVIRTNLNLNLEDIAAATLEYQGEKLNLILTDQGHLDLVGTADAVTIQSDDESKIDGPEFSCDKLMVQMENGSMVKLKKARAISGDIEDRAVLHFEQACHTSKINKQDRAVISFSSDS